MSEEENAPLGDEQIVQGQGQGQEVDVVESLVKNKGEKFRDIKEVAKAYLELEKAHGKSATDKKKMEDDLVQLYGFYQTFNPYVNDIKGILSKKDPAAFERIFGTEELGNMEDENDEEGSEGKVNKSPIKELKGMNSAKDMLKAFKNDPEGVRKALLDILGPVLQPLQRQGRSLSISRALDVMEKDTENFPYFKKVAKEMTTILGNLPDEMVPKTIEGYKYLYEAAVGRNSDIIWDEKKKGIIRETYKNIAEKGFEIEGDEGILPDNYGSSGDKEVMAVVNAKGSKL